MYVNDQYDCHFAPPDSKCSTELLAVETPSVSAPPSPSEDTLTFISNFRPFSSSLFSSLSYFLLPSRPSLLSFFLPLRLPRGLKSKVFSYFCESKHFSLPAFLCRAVSPLILHRKSEDTRTQPKTNSVALVRKRTIPTERPPLSAK
jgi:hypothetical protein